MSRPVMHPSLTPADVLRQLDALGIVPAGVTDDSRQVVPGDLFVAYRSALADNRRYIGNAIARDAVAVLWEAGDDFVWSPE